MKYYDDSNCCYTTVNTIHCAYMGYNTELTILNSDSLRILMYQKETSSSH